MVAGPYSFEGSSLITAPQAVLSDHPRILEGVAVLDTATGDVTYRYDEAVSDVGWARDRRLFARFADDRVFRIIDARTGEQVGGSLWNVDRLWPTLDGRSLLAVLADGWIQTIDPRTGATEGDSWRLEGEPVWVSIAPDGDRIAVTYWSDGTTNDIDNSSSGRRGTWLAIVSAEDHHRILSEEPIVVREHVLLEDGDLIGLEDYRMGRYETEPLARVGTVPGAAGGRDSPSLTSDARTLLVMAEDGTALLYDTTGDLIGEPFPTDDRTLAPAVLRPDGLEMAVSTPDGVVVWDIDPDHQFEYVCRIAGRDLTDNEWRTYLPQFGARQSTCGFD
jgi:hypothetical protein